jgi:serine/threonine protein kinase/Tol biopolymer transport system component
MIGQKLGVFEVVAKLGEGGMGEVYRARDTKLDRDVAIKVLPKHLSADPEALARFEREAKAVAALSHPNILDIHDFGRDAASGTAYAVMELLEGATLRERLSAGPLPLKKVVQIGVDIAHGLAAAHARGLVHRDLKPENIFVTTDGRVKILDFGLARTLAPEVDGALRDRADSPTALRQTDPGTVLGTVGYMSPEQVKGHPADHRSDVFSLGCVLYELATGRRAFQRDTPAETMTAILREDPPELSRDGVSAPAALEPVIRHCLEKQPDERFQSARDLAFALHSSAASTTSISGASAIPVPAPVKRRVPIAALAGAVVLAAGAFFAGRQFGSLTGPSGSTAFTFRQLTDGAGVETDPSISPDGVSVAYASTTKGTSDIYVQRIGGRNALLVAGDAGRDEAAPAFSPDGAAIAFHVKGGRGGIFITGATGESVRRVTDFGFHPAWSPDGQRLVFCTEQIVNPAGRSSASTLWIVDARGGAPTKLSDGDGVEPVWSPSGARIAYWAVDTGQRDLYTIPAAGGPRTAVTHDAAMDWGPKWSADGKYLYFSSDRGGSMNIWRIPIDETTGAATGAPEPVTQGVTAAEQATLSRDGARLAFRSAMSATNPVAIPFDPAAERAGSPTPILDRTGSMIPTGISPDGQWLSMFNVFEHQEDIFIARVDGSDLRRLTDDEFRDRAPVWSPDGKEIAFYSNRTDNYGIWSVKPDASGLRPLTERGKGNEHNLLYPAYSPSGDRMVASRLRADETVLFDPRRGWNAQTPESVSMRVSEDSWLAPQSWSPDGRLIAGTIVNVAGSAVAVGVYDVAARKPRIIVEGGSGFQGFVWLPDNRRVVFVDPLVTTLWLIDVDSGRRKALMTGQRLAAGLVASPDRRTLYGSINRQQADLWIVELR